MKDSAVKGRLPVRRTELCCAPLSAPGMLPERTALLAARLRALADPTRLRLLDLLAQQPEPVCVCDITPHFAQNQPTISHHLKLLRDAGFISCEKRGIWSYYRATEEGRLALNLVTALA